MDPVFAIAEALIVGAIASSFGMAWAVRDAYQALKTILVESYHVASVQFLEEDPTNPAIWKSVKNELASKPNLGNDKAVFQRVQALQKALGDDSPSSRPPMRHDTHLALIVDLLHRWLRAREPNFVADIRISGITPGVITENSRFRLPLNKRLSIDQMADFPPVHRYALDDLSPKELRPASKAKKDAAKKTARATVRRELKPGARVAPASTGRLNINPDPAPVPPRGKPKPRDKVSLGSASSSPAEAAKEIVDCSIFGPPAAPPGETVLVQAFLHLADQVERASFLATTMDGSVKLKATKSLDLPIRRGARVAIAFSANGLEVDDPVQGVVWQGEPTFCQFLATLPAGTSGQSFFPVIRVSVDGKLIGSIKFRLSSDAAASEPSSKPLGDHAKRYEHAFVSYASKDRKEVLKRVQMLEILKTKFFQDILALDPGDRWEKKLYENIDKCDLFLLFWSQAAKDSQWVMKEAEYALAHQQKNAHSEPDLVPVVLEQNVLPPPSLSAFHFNDRISYLTSLRP